MRTGALLGDASLRVLGDPSADEVAEELTRTGRLWPTNALLRDVRANADALPTTLPLPVRRFFEQQAALPRWASAERLERAAVWADAHLPYLSVSLLAASLPILFSSAKGAAVLHTTRRLVDDVDRRVNETGQFVLDVVARGGFGARGSAVVSILKVRLVHASVRISMRAKLGSDETPINQQDLLATLLAFSIVALRASERLGLQVSRHEAEDYWHLWRVAGVLMGIDERLLPHDAAAARALEAAFTARLADGAPSEHSRLLTRALLEGMQRHVPVPGMSTAPARLVRYLVGDRLAAHLGVPEPSSSTRWLRGTAWLQARAPDVMQVLGPLFARRIHESIVRAKLQRSAPAFPMPSAPVEGERP